MKGLRLSEGSVKRSRDLFQHTDTKAVKINYVDYGVRGRGGGSMALEMAQLS